MYRHSRQPPGTARSQRPLPLEFMNGLSYKTIIDLAESLAGLFCRSQAKTDRQWLSIGSLGGYTI